MLYELIEEYCLPTVAEAINTFGGINVGRYLPRKIDLEAQDTYQMGLFDDL